MNRLQGDYFEKLLYKIFVSIDEHTTVAEVRQAKRKREERGGGGVVSGLV